MLRPGSALSQTRHALAVVIWCEGSEGKTDYGEDKNHGSERNAVTSSVSLLLSASVSVLFRLIILDILKNQFSWRNVGKGAELLLTEIFLLPK